MSNASMKIDLPGVDFAQLAREAIAARFAEAMVGHEDAIKKIVVAAMETKVGENGQESRYSYENKIPYVEWMARDLIRGATLDVLRAKVEELRPIIATEVERQLVKSAKTVAVALTDSFIAQAKGSYGVTVNLTAAFKQRDW